MSSVSMPIIAQVNRQVDLSWNCDILHGVSFCDSNKGVAETQDLQALLHFLVKWDLNDSFLFQLIVKYGISPTCNQASLSSYYLVYGILYQLTLSAARTSNRNSWWRCRNRNRCLDARLPRFIWQICCCNSRCRSCSRTLFRKCRYCLGLWGNNFPIGCGWKGRLSVHRFATRRDDLLLGCRVIWCGDYRRSISSHRLSLLGLNRCLRWTQDMYFKPTQQNEHVRQNVLDLSSC